MHRSMIYSPIVRESNGSLFGSGRGERADVGERAIGRREVCPARVTLLPDGETRERSTADQSSQGNLCVYLSVYLFVLLESLCSQTEKLENARLQINHLKVIYLSICISICLTDTIFWLIRLIYSIDIAIHFLNGWL